MEPTRKVANTAVLGLVLLAFSANTCAGSMITLAVDGVFENGAILDGTITIDNVTGAVTGQNLLLDSPGPPVSLTFSVQLNESSIDPFGTDWLTAFATAANPFSYPEIELIFPTDTLVGYEGGLLCSGFETCFDGFSDVTGGLFLESGTGIPLLTGSTAQATTLWLAGGLSSTPAPLPNEPVAEVTGTIAGLGSEDYYSFLWAGGAFSATASITGANTGASYLFSEGVAGCSDGGTATLNSGDGFTGTIAIADLAPGQYCIGLDANNSNDPTFALTFNTPVEGTTPEPSTFLLLPVGFVTIGMLLRFTKRSRDGS